MRNKPSRWWARLDDGRVAIYNDPRPTCASAVSLVAPSDLEYYRRNFDLSPVWADER